MRCACRSSHAARARAIGRRVAARQRRLCCRLRASCDTRDRSAARTARLQPGVRNLAISEAAAKYGLYYAPDPSSQIACSIGGNVPENAGGMNCLKYGLTVHNVLKVRAYTVEG